MRVLFLLNRGGVGGGHVIQATKTAEALSGLGVEVTLDEELSGKGLDVDLVHSFGASPVSLRLARIHGAAVVVSTIWWSAEYVTGRSSRTRLQGVERGVRIAHSAVRRGIDETAKRLRDPFIKKANVFELADLLLPNSQLEADQIRADLDVTTPMHIVPNAFDNGIFTPPPPESQRNGVAFVGRIEPHKNPLGLIRELKGTGIPLTIAGPVHPHHVDYWELCRRTADGSVTFAPEGDQIAMRDVYRAAQVHVLPSWFETTGLSSLEAAATGCAVVSTNRGYAQEYLGTDAVYCDPGADGSIRDAVLAALKRGPSEALRSRVLARYTWARAAEATLEGYHLALRGHSRVAGSAE